MWCLNQLCVVAVLVFAFEKWVNCFVGGFIIWGRRKAWTSHRHLHQTTRNVFIKLGEIDEENRRICWRNYLKVF